MTTNTKTNWCAKPGRPATFRSRRRHRTVAIFCGGQAGPPRLYWRAGTGGAAQAAELCNGEQPPVAKTLWRLFWCTSVAGDARKKQPNDDEHGETQRNYYEQTRRRGR
jgi:hypothetical protein